jgi:hypothetical protein
VNADEDKGKHVDGADRGHEDQAVRGHRPEALESGAQDENSLDHFRTR